MNDIKLTERQQHLFNLLVEAARNGESVYGDRLLRDGVQQRTISALVKRGLIEASDQGWVLSEAGREAAGAMVAIDGEPRSQASKAKPAKKAADLNRCACSEDCEALSRNLFAPGHDARWAGIMGRWVVANHASDPQETIRRMAPVGASEALIAKAVRVAANAQAKADAKKARQSDKAA
ncbi:hypothetical protein [Mycolicibacter arupensis]|jgi:hypothetical protein|uniref:Uncharacterized protein n=1 Tax=Mycolicibacter arupensis TaxID=342002 RepID=A0A5C7YEE9_9MYCO|nr:hypothetical protein [Mycolicibacter arupensis]TXI59956.1 MAG: hypothetical protein E6Q54_01415 [Mycolicibacter arupensis]